MRDTKIAYIGLGSNLGDREDAINSALNMLAEAEHIEIARTSDLIETTPLAQANQPNYLNTVAEIKTALSAEELYRKIAAIETTLGRVRQIKWAPRTIDLDLLLFGQDVINHSHLTVPHRQMHLRSFVLKGLCQLNDNLIHPVIKESMNELLARLGSADFVLNPDLPQLLCIAGIIGVGKTTLAKKLSHALGCKLLLEPYDTNPFLPDVYAGRKDLALDSQLYFLTHRAEQLNTETLEQGQIAISDYTFDKEFIYARRLLNARQLALYEKLYQPFSPKISAPVLVVYMQDSAQSCLERIHKRNRPYEQQIEQQFLQTLNSDYEQLFKHWKTCPVIRTSLQKLDYMKEANIDHLENQVKSYVAV